MIEKSWGYYLKLVAVAPSIGILCLWAYLKGEHLSLVGFIGASSHILIAIALVGLVSLAFSGATLWPIILLPFKSGISGIILSAMQRRTLFRRRRAGVNTMRPRYWLAFTYVVPSVLGVTLGLYLGRGDNFMAWLWGFGVTPSLLTWFLLLSCGLGRRLQPFFALMTLLIVAFIVTSVTVILLLSIMPSIRTISSTSVGVVHWMDWARYHCSQFLLAAGLSTGMTSLLAPAKSERSVKVKLVLTTILIVLAAFLRATAIYIVQVAFFLFASGGEHRTYTSMTGTALDLPHLACADASCHTSRPIRITADLGNVIYANYDYIDANGNLKVSSLTKLEMSKATYDVDRVDRPFFRGLQIL